MNKRTLIVGNWKMNLSVGQSSLLVARLQKHISPHREIEVVLAPSMLALQPLAQEIDRRTFRLAAQNAYYKDEGPYTGEVSFAMLQDIVHYVIVGHSDRRHKFHESLDDICAKMAAAVRYNITPILCVGETAQERAEGETMRVLHDQVVTGLHDITAEEIENIVIAYEPVWALSSGSDYMHHEIPAPDNIAKAIATIVGNISELYGKKAATNVRVLYGGSTNASTAGGLLGAAGVDGLLVGGASLNYKEFSGIVEAAYRLRKKSA